MGGGLITDLHWNYLTAPIENTQNVSQLLSKLHLIKTDFFLHEFLTEMRYWYFVLFYRWIHLHARPWNRIPHPNSTILAAGQQNIPNGVPSVQQTEKNRELFQNLLHPKTREYLFYLLSIFFGGGGKKEIVKVLNDFFIGFAKK